MATTNPQFITTLATFLIIATFIVSHDGLVSGQGCQGDVQSLIKQCAIYVQRAGPTVDPSNACCIVVNRVDIPCVCKYITGAIAQMIDMQKVAYVAEYCGKPFAPGTKCGNYTAPGGDDEESEALVPNGESEAPSPNVEDSEALEGLGGEEESEALISSGESKALSPSVEDGEVPNPSVDFMPWMPWIIRGPKY